MKPGLLKNATKVSAAGYKYRTIPFDQGKSKSNSSGYEAGLVAKVKYNLRQINRIRKKAGQDSIPYKGIEKNADGTPKLGKLHSFNFGGAIPGKGNTPALNGVSIYQTLTKSGNVRRDILTFRTVSGGPASEGKWIHPGREGSHFFENAEKFALKEWEETILPEILSKWK